MWKDQTILIGHSYGVTAALGAARRSGVFVPVMYSFDPSQWWWMSWRLQGSGGNAVPSNIKRVVNFYQPHGAIGRQRLYRDDGHMVREVSQESVFNFVWTPDGSGLYYLVKTEQTNRLMVVSVPDGEPIQLHPSPGLYRFVLIEGPKESQ